MSLHRGQRQLGRAHGLPRPRRRDVHGRPVPPLAAGRLHRRHGDGDRRTPWSQPQHPARELPAPTTKSTALGSTNPCPDFTAARAPCADNDLSGLSTRVTRRPCTNPAPTVSRHQDDKLVSFQRPLRCPHVHVRLRVMAGSSAWLSRPHPSGGAARVAPHRKQCRQPGDSGIHAGLFNDQRVVRCQRLHFGMRQRRLLGVGFGVMREGDLFHWDTCLDQPSPQTIAHTEGVTSCNRLPLRSQRLTV